MNRGGEMVNRGLRGFVTLWLALGLVTCGGRTTMSGGSETNTNFLESCDTDAQCGTSLACRCGICTTTCWSHSECELGDESGVCSTTESCEAVALCFPSELLAIENQEPAPVQSTGASTTDLAESRDATSATATDETAGDETATDETATATTNLETADVISTSSAGAASDVDVATLTATTAPDTTPAPTGTTCNDCVAFSCEAEWQACTSTEGCQEIWNAFANCVRDNPSADPWADFDACAAGASDTGDALDLPYEVQSVMSCATAQFDGNPDEDDVFLRAEGDGTCTLPCYNLVSMEQ